MSVSIGAALKKIAVAVLTDKKLRNTVLGIILGIIIIIVMPFAAIIALFNGSIEIDTDRLHSMVVENLSEEERSRLQFVEDTMNGIEIKMSETEYDSRQILAAQVLYVTMLSEQASDPGFIDKLVGCFSAEQTDTQLIVNINLAFGTDISADEFTKFMSSIHKRIVSVALSQLGNEGGELFWSWYGFESRVEWCACFVSWCADQCGYLDSGQIPKFAGCGIGVDWFKEHDQWLDGGETPSSGMIIFFDWNDEDGQDGWSDHVGIVEKVENGYVYTIEGNSGDACCQRSYPIGHNEILGYGTY